MPSAAIERLTEQRAAAAQLTALALAEEKARSAYMVAPDGTEREWADDSLHVKWHMALRAWTEARLAYQAQYGEVTAGTR